MEAKTGQTTKRNVYNIIDKVARSGTLPCRRFIDYLVPAS